MEDNKNLQENLAETALNDEGMEQVSGGAAVTSGQAFTLSIPSGTQMNELWIMMKVYGEYGNAVKEVVDTYCANTGLQKWGVRYTAARDITVVASGGIEVKVNGVTLYLPE